MSQPTDFSAPLFHHRHDIPALVQDFLASATLAPEEKEQEEEALRLVRALDTKDGTEPDRLASLQGLADRGSQTASLGVAIVLIRGERTGQNRARGLALVRELCDRGFVPAHAELARHLRVDSLLKHDYSFLPQVLAGCALGEAASLLFLGQYLHRSLHLLPGLDVPTLARQLLALAASGCWEALDILVRCFLVSEPGFLPVEVREAALALLVQACRLDWPEAMVLYAEVLCDGTLCVRETEAAKDWYARACALHSMEACAGLGLLLVHEAQTQCRDNEEVRAVLARARTLLEPGCAQEHPGCLAAMAGLVRAEDAIADSGTESSLWANPSRHWNNKDVHRLLARAADLGNPEPYVRFLWEGLVDMQRDKLPSLRFAAFARDELERLAAAGHECARHRIGCLRTFLAQTEHYAALARDGVSGEVQDAGLDTLTQCVHAFYGPAFASLAEIGLLGTRAGQRAEDWIKDLAKHGRAVHDVRSAALCVLRELDAVKGRNALVLLQTSPDLLSLLFWSAKKQDLLARAMVECLCLGIGYPKPLLENPLLAALMDRQQAQPADSAPFITDLAQQASRQGDWATLLYLARQLDRGSQSAAAEELARALGPLFLQEGETSARTMSSVLVLVSNAYGANHDGNFGAAGTPRTAAEREADRKKDKARQARKAAKKAKKRR